jgi:prevent-host-death family protein
MATRDQGTKSGGARAVSHSEARRRFSALVEEAMSGKPVMLEHRGKPTVMIVDAKAYARRPVNVRPALMEALRRQFLEENEAALGPDADRGIEGALFSGSIEAEVPE